MAPKSPWNKAKSGSKPQNTAAPSANTAGNDGISPANTTDYEQTQNDELEALRAIYMEDFQEVETKSAWSKHSDRAFRIRLRSMSDNEVSIVLSVKLTATYPKTVPSVTLQEPVGIRTKTQKSLEKLLKTKPKELLGEVMIYEIATAVQDLLEDEAQFKAKGEALPSLEQERVVQEAVTTKLAKQQEEEQLRRKKEEKAEEDRVLQQMVEDEMNRRRDMKRKSKAIAPDFSAQGQYLLSTVVKPHPKRILMC
jgi:translation initiation factor 2-alpha kinase 4